MSSENIKIGFTYGLATISIDSTMKKNEIFSCADRMLFIEKRKKKVGRQEESRKSEILLF